MLCWALWKSCNELVWNQRRQRVDEVVSFATLTLNQWTAAQGVGNIPSLNPLHSSDGVEQWTKPGINTIKINVEATIFEEERKFGYTFVVRDSDGKLVTTLTKCSVGSVTPSLVEVMGIKEVFSWLGTQQYSRVVVESDSLVSIQAIRSSFTMLSGFGLVVEDCKTLLRSLSNVDLHFVERSANRAAHVTRLVVVYFMRGISLLNSLLHC